MNTEKKIAEIKNLLRDIEDRLQNFMTDSAETNREKTKELEQLTQLLYTNVLSLAIIEELKQNFITTSPQNMQEQDDNLPNQLSMDFSKDVVADPVEKINEENKKGQTEHIKTYSHPSAPLNIGLNDKFRFIKELFEDSTQEYTIAINQLNSIASKSEAFIYIDSLKNIYRWQDDNDCFISFLEIINKRFP